MSNYYVSRNEPLTAAAQRRTAKAYGRLLSKRTAAGLTKAEYRRFLTIGLSFWYNEYNDDRVVEIQAKLDALKNERWAPGQRHYKTKTCLDG